MNSEQGNPSLGHILVFPNRWAVPLCLQTSGLSDVPVNASPGSPGSVQLGHTWRQGIWWKSMRITVIEHVLCSRYWVRPLISVISLNSHNCEVWIFHIYKWESDIWFKDLPKAIQFENGGAKIWVKTSNNKANAILPTSETEMNSYEWGLVYIGHADKARMTSVIWVQVWKKETPQEWANHFFLTGTKPGKVGRETFPQQWCLRELFVMRKMYCLPCPIW